MIFLKDALIVITTRLRTVRAVTNCDVGEWDTRDIIELYTNHKSFVPVVTHLYEVS